MFKPFRILFYLSLVLPVVACQAEESSPAFEAGVHYELLEQPVPTTDPGRVEVVEMFWYGCSHCFHFEPLVNEWIKKLPEKAQFVPMPAVWHPDMELHAQAFYAAKALNVLDSMHEKIFEAMNIKKNHLRSKEEIAGLFEANGVDREKFLAVFDSFGVKQSVTMAKSRQLAYRIQGTPELIVNGKYRISGRHTGSQAKMLEVASFLIDKELKASH